MLSLGCMDSTVVIPNNRKVHVQSIARACSREKLAEDVVDLKKQVHESNAREQKLLVCKRRLEAEVQSLQSNLNKAEEILHKRTSSFSPNKMITCFNQSPEQTSLVQSLKIQNRELMQTRNELEAELIRVNKSARMTRINELEFQNIVSQDEIVHQKAISEFLFHRLKEAEKATDAAANIAARVAKNLDGCCADSPSGKKSPEKTMDALQNAHQVLIQHANVIRARIPIGSTFKQLEGEKAPIGRPAKGPVLILKYLRAHLSRMESTLLGLPGGQTDTEKKEAKIKPRPQFASRQAKKKSDIAKTIESQVGEVLTCLENGGMDANRASPQIENLIDVLESLKNQIAQAVMVKRNKENNGAAEPLLIPLKPECAEEIKQHTAAYSGDEALAPAKNPPVIVIPTALADRRLSVKKSGDFESSLYSEISGDRNLEKLASPAEPKEQLDTCNGPTQLLLETDACEDLPGDKNKSLEGNIALDSGEKHARLHENSSRSPCGSTSINDTVPGQIEDATGEVSKKVEEPIQTEADITEGLDYNVTNQPIDAIPEQNNKQPDQGSDEDVVVYEYDEEFEDTPIEENCKINKSDASREHRVEDNSLLPVQTCMETCANVCSPSNGEADSSRIISHSSDYEAETNDLPMLPAEECITENVTPQFSIDRGCNSSNNSNREPGCREMTECESHRTIGLTEANVEIPSIQEEIKEEDFASEHETVPESEECISEMQCVQGILESETIPDVVEEVSSSGQSSIVLEEEQCYESDDFCEEEEEQGVQVDQSSAQGAGASAQCLISTPVPTSSLSSGEELNVEQGLREIQRKASFESLFETRPPRRDSCTSSQAIDDLLAKLEREMSIESKNADPLTLD